MKEHHMKLNPSSFSKIVRGERDIEIRLFDEKRREVCLGDKITFTNTETGETVTTRVAGLYIFPRFINLFTNIDVTRVGWEYYISPKEATEGMRKYYSEEEEERYGVVGIQIEVE